MVTSILKTIRSGFAVLASLLFLVRPEVALAATAELAPGLTLTLPKPLALSVVESPAQSKGPVLVGEIGEEPGYFLAAIRVSQWERNNTLWHKLEDEIAQRSASRTMEIGARGNFVTLNGDKAWYREYLFEADGRPQRQVYYLLRSERSIFWIVLTIREGLDTDLVLPIARVLIQRARLEN